MEKIKDKTEVVLEGRGTLILRPSDHVATGGEGSVYQKSNTVIKIYSDRSKMVRDGMEEKIRILSAIKHKFIVSPDNLVMDGGGKPIGFYMPLAEGEPLPRVFTNDFRKRENFGDSDSSILVDRMKEAVQFAHSKGAVLVDANEMNWLVKLDKKNGPEPRAIDVDSWAIGRWGAQVIMPSIRDWHAKRFDQLTDWFAWGIVTFQIYCGIHPFKGKLDGYKPNEMERRMKDNASVFSKNICLNRAVRDFSSVPGPLLDWYFKVFQKGLRSAPPSPFDSGVQAAQAGKVMYATVTASGMLVFDKLYGDLKSRAIKIFPCGLVLMDSGAIINLRNQKMIAAAKSRKCELVEVQGGWLKADEDGGKIVFSHIDATSLREESLALSIDGKRIIRYENRLFLVTEKGLTEVIFKKLGRPILAIGQTWGAMPNATKWFDGVGVQDTMGATYLIAPFGEKACVQIRAKELDGMVPVAAKAGNRFIALVMLDQGGNYQKFELTMDREYVTYKLWQGGADTAELNIAILPKGVCATIVDDGELNIFVPANATLNKVADKNISADMALSNWDNKVVYIKDGAIWQVKMK